MKWLKWLKWFGRPRVRTIPAPFIGVLSPNEKFLTVIGNAGHSLAIQQVIRWLPGEGVRVWHLKLMGR